MRLKHLLIFTFLILSKPVFSQDSTFVEKVKVPVFIDTLFVDRDVNNWSIRVFSNYKTNRFRIINSDQYVSFATNNPLRYGVGVATRKLLLDFSFNSKPKDKESTKRTDFMATFLYENHQMDYFFQRNQGYDTKNGMIETFRPDITTFSSGIRYLYMFNADEYSMAARKTGLARQKKTALTSGLGGFLFVNRIKGDSSIIAQEVEPNFNEEARIENLLGIGAGVLVNLSVTVPFFQDFFVSGLITPGIGLMWKDVDSETVSYYPKNPLLYQIDVAGILGYTSERIYINLTLAYGVYGTNLDFGNRLLNSRTSLKLAVGYKLRKKKQL